MARWQEMTDYLQSRGIKVGAGTLGQTTGGTHTRGSYHYQGVARDFGVYNCDCPAIAAALKPLATGGNHVIVELIWTPSPLSRSSGPGTYMKHGGAYVPTVKLANGHKDHVHAAIKPGAPHWTSWPGANASKPQPQPQPAPVPQKRRSDPMYVVQGTVEDPIYATNFVTKQWLETEVIKNHTLLWSENKKVDKLDQDTLDNIPLVGIAPPGYAPNGKFAEQH